MTISPRTETENPALAVDAHVHLYPEAEVGHALSAGYDQLTRAAARKGFASVRPVLLLTETARSDAFGALADGNLTADGWSVGAFGNDPVTLRLRRGSDGAELILVAGRQIVTAERIEILAFATPRRFADGQRASDVLRALAEDGIPAALPWGLGKWIGKRGRLIEELVAQTPRGSGLGLGDNAGRPYGWPTPAVFGRAMRRGMAVLPGSDPLPLARAETGIGRFGGVIDAALDPQAPGRSLREILCAPGLEVHQIGVRQSPLEVLKWQRAYRARPRAPG